MRLVLDVESYFDNEYSLKKMHTLEYVRDSRFHLYGVAVKIDDQPAEFIYGDDFQSFVDGLSNDVELICHNTYFDGLVLFHHYQFVPAVYRDTLSMARALLPHLPNHDLDSLAKFLKLGNKMPEVLDLTKGQRTLPPEVLSKLAEYAIQDVELTDGVFSSFLPALPDDELELIHLTLKWGCRPVLHVDLPRAKEALKHAVKERASKIDASGEPLEVLSSQPKFVEALERREISVPTKRNKKGLEIPALAKNDLGFKEMVRKYPEHRALFEGRLAAKSTIDVTRIKRVIDIGSSGTLPMPLKYYGAHTGRWSGADGLNPQNFRRGSELRKSIIAPPGWAILVADQKQIEARMNMWFCGEQHWLGIFRDGIDIYSALAADHFDVPIEEVTDAQRFFGKTLELGLGYQMGWRTFQRNCILRGIDMDEAGAYEAVSRYRESHMMIQLMWRHLQNTLPHLIKRDCPAEIFSLQYPLSFTHEGIILPNHMRIDYWNLRALEGGEWVYGDHTYIYGGKMLENIIQALARIVIGQNMLRIHRTHDGFIDIVSSTHDEIIALVRERDAELAVSLVTDIMCTPPDWAPDLPLDVDIGYAREYSK